MGKESKAGTQFYANAGLKAVTIHLPKTIHKKLLLLAAKEDRSLQKSIRRILVEYVGRKKIVDH